MSMQPFHSGPGGALTERGTGARHFFAVLRRRGWILLACLLVVPAAVYLYTKRQPKVYQASVVVQPQSRAPDTIPEVNLLFNALGGEPQLVAAYAQSRRVVAATAALLHQPSSAGGLASSSDEHTGWVTLTATGSDPRKSAKTANAFATALGRDLTSEARGEVIALTRGTRQRLRLEHNPLRRHQLIQALRGLRALPTTGQVLEVVQAAGGATVVSPHPRRNARLAVILALLVGAGLIALVEYLDRRVRKAEDLAELAGAPLLGAFSRDAFRRGRRAPRPAEGFQALRDMLSYSQEELAVLVVASPLRREGRTTVAAGLAVAFARAGRRVVLIDADMRSPRVASRMGVPASPGLSEVLMGRGDPRSTLQDVGGVEGDLKILPAGTIPPNPGELLGSRRMAKLLEDLAEGFDLVVIDTAPLLAVSDTVPLLRRASGVLGLARLNKTPKDAVRRMTNLVGSAGGRLLGVAATGAGARLRPRRERYRRPPAWGPRPPHTNGKVTAPGPSPTAPTSEAR